MLPLLFIVSTLISPKSSLDIELLTRFGFERIESEMLI